MCAAAAHRGRAAWYKGRVRRVLSAGLLMSALGCSFDASGITESSAAGPGDPGTGTGASTAGSGNVGPSSGEPVTTGGEGTAVVSSGGVDPPTTGGPDTGEPMTTDVSMTTGTPDPGTSETSGPPDTTGPPDDSTTTGAPACPQFYKQIVTVEQATVVAPMGKHDSMVETSVVAYSATAEQGIINFPVTPPCDGPVAVWARVLDANPGSFQMGDPDSFYPHVDNDVETGWFYGCQTQNKQDDEYYWLRVRGGVVGMQCNQYPDWSPQLTAGPHTVTLRNREGQNQQLAVAAVSRLLVTSDLNYVPDGND